MLAMPRNAPQVLVADALPLEEMEPLEQAGIGVVDRRGVDAAGLIREIPRYVGLLVRSRTQVGAELLQAAGDLRVVGRAGTGVDNIDVEAATRAGVLVMNVPGGNTLAAAEHTIALLMALARHVVPAAAGLREGTWERKGFVGVQVTGRTLGVVGLGRIGREVARRAQGLGMKVIVHDPLLAPEAAEEMGFTFASLEELAAGSDFLTVHVPLVAGTRHLVGRELLEHARTGIHILNVARGGVVDEEALLEALESGRVAGAALDVFEQEPPQNTRLLRHPRVLATPHLGASTAEAQRSVARQIAGQVAAYLTRGVVRNAVNAVGWDAEAQEDARPWMELCRRLGAAAGGLSEGPPRQVEVVLFGRISGQPKEPLVSSVLTGLLQPFVGRRINVVNAPLVAEEHEIQVSAGLRDRHKSFHSVVRVAVRTGDRRVALSGTLFGHSQLRIIRAFGFNIDAIPEGPMLLVSNRDRPGIIGHLGTTLAQAGINIANMSVGRDPEHERALAVLNLDQDPPDELLDQLAAAPDILWIRRLRLPTGG